MLDRVTQTLYKKRRSNSPRPNSGEPEKERRRLSKFFSCPPELGLGAFYTGSKIAPLLALLIVALASPGFCQVVPPAPQSLPTPLTLSDAIAIALRQQPQQFIARDQVTQAQGQKQQAQAQYFPTLRPTYQIQNHSQSIYGISTGTGTTTGITGTGVTGTGTGTTTTGTNLTTSRSAVTTVRGGGLAISLSQNLYDGGAREATNAEARHALDAANDNSLNTRQATILTVTQDYYQLLLNLDLVKVAQAQVTRYQQTVDVIQAQIDVGTTAAKDIYQAKSDLANAQVTLLQDQNQVQFASSTLKNALGVATDATVQPALLAGGDQLPPLPSSGPAVTLDAALLTAYANRPDLRQQQATIESQNAALQQARHLAGFTVRSDYVLTYQATNDTGNRGTDSQLLVTGSYPLFDAGSARGAVRVAQSQRDIAQNQLEQVRQQIRLDVEQAYNTRGTNLQATQLAQAAVTAAQVNYDAAVDARRQGIGTVLDITTAQATLTQAQNQYVSAVYNFYIADAQLQRALGGNDAALR